MLAIFHTPPVFIQIIMLIIITVSIAGDYCKINTFVMISYDYIAFHVKINKEMRKNHTKLHELFAKNNTNRHEKPKIAI